MNTYLLTKFDDWDDFDQISLALRKIGWIAKQNVDGPDARICSFERNNLQIWLVFDDMLGCSLKSENSAFDLQSIAEELQKSPLMKTDTASLKSKFIVT